MGDHVASAAEAPFDIRATRVSPFAKGTPVSLVCLPEAGTQRGTLVVGSSGSKGIRVQNNRLTPIPAEPYAPVSSGNPPDQSGATRGTYRYDPLRDVVSAGAEAVIVSPGDGQLGPPTAWAWSCHLESRYESDGTGRHLATYRLQNAGREQSGITGTVVVELPQPLTQKSVRGIWIDETRVAWHGSLDPDDRRIIVAIPPGQRFAVVSIHFLTHGPPLGTFASLEPVLPEIDIPALARTWTVWLPPGYQAADGSLPGRRAAGPSMAFAKRLFGPLGREAGSGPFRFWRAEDWARLVARYPEQASASALARQLLEQLGAAETSQQQPVAGSGEAGSGGREAGGERREPRSGEAAPPPPIPRPQPPVPHPPSPAARATWGDLLLPASEDSRWKLLVDRRALARIGLTARSRVVAPAASLQGGRGIVLLQQADLALFCLSDVVLLTSGTDAALHRASLVPTGHETAWYVLPGPLADRLLQAGHGKDDPWFVPVAAWVQTPSEPRVPWPVVDLAGHGPTDTLGWTAYRIDLAGETGVRLSIVHRETMRALGWAAFLAVFALGAWRGLLRPEWLILIAGLAAAAALLLSEVYVPMASGALLGAICGGGPRGGWREEEERGRRGEGEKRRRGEGEKGRRGEGERGRRGEGDREISR